MRQNNFLDNILPPRLLQINRALAPWVRNPGTGSGVKCCNCGSDKVVHITGIKDYWQCFSCRAILIVKREEKIG